MDVYNLLIPINIYPETTRYCFAYEQKKHIKTGNSDGKCEILVSTYRIPSVSDIRKNNININIRDPVFFDNCPIVQ